jgi:ribosomal protein S18 acetylase RimI-like enzyme
MLITMVLHTEAQALGHSISLALHTSHQHLAIADGEAVRYPGDIAPFAAVPDYSAESLAQLRSLMGDGERVYLMGERPPDSPGLRWDGVVPCLQMLWPEEIAVPALDGAITLEPLSCANAQEMLDLIAIAYPGYFRAQTCRMGSYFGVRKGGALVAMGGERLVFEHGRRVYREISGLCTHPEHTGKGLGTALLNHLLREHRAAGAVSWLHVTKDNTHAIALYERLGFVTVRTVDLHRMLRKAI